MKFDKIVGVGCSFTEGGGLNNLSYYQFLNKTDKLVDEKILNDFSYKNNYIAQLANKLDLPYENLSESQSSNELIFEKIYNRFVDNTDEILLILQTTFFGRKHIWDSETERFHKMSGGNLDGDVINDSINTWHHRINNFYKNYLGYFYSEKNEETKTFNMVRVFESFLKERNVTTILIPLFCENYNNFIEKTLLFDNKNLLSFIEKNKLKISDLDIGISDEHLSLEGNKLLADKLYNFIQNEI